MHGHRGGLSSIFVFVRLYYLILKAQPWGYGAHKISTRRSERLAHEEAMLMRIMSKAQMRVALVPIAPIVLVSMLLLAGCASPLHNAAKMGDIRKVNQLITDGADVNAKGGSDWTPLHWAASRGNTETALK